MLRIMTELVPHGDESKAELLSIIAIANSLKKAEDSRYIYRYILDVDGKQTKGNVKHDRADNHLKLLQLVLADIKRQGGMK